MAVLKADEIKADLKRNTDFVRAGVLLCLWNSCEANSVIIAGCIPTIKSLFDKLRGHSPYPGSGPRSRLRFGRSLGAKSSGTHHTARSQSYKLSSKAAVNTASSFDDDDLPDKYHFTAVTLKPDYHAEAARTIRVTREFDVAEEDRSRLVHTNAGTISAPSHHVKGRP